jgi:membrane-bound ClpP family serine protease
MAKRSIVSTARDIVSTVRKGAQDLAASAQQAVLVLEERMLERLTTTLCAIGAYVFLALAALFLMLDQLHWPRAGAFGLVGLVMLVVALWRKNRALRRGNSALRR